MSRPDGFVDARHDVGFLVDDRILDALEAAGPWAVLAYIAVRDASWARGERVTFAQATRRLPMPYGPAQGTLEALLFCGLLDEEGRIPEATWTAWFGRAQERREQLRELGQKGGLAKAGKRPPTERSSARSSARSSGSSGIPSDRPTAAATDVAAVGLSPSAAADPDGPRRRSPPDEPDDLWPMVDGRVQVPQGDTKLEAPAGYVDPGRTETFAEKMARHGLRDDVRPTS